MVTAILNLVYGFLTSIIELFPTGTGFDTDVHTAFQTLGEFMHVLDPMIPFDTLFQCLTLIFTVEFAVWTFKSIKWLASHIPWIGGKGV